MKYEVSSIRSACMYLLENVSAGEMSYLLLDMRNYKLVECLLRIIKNCY